MSHEEAILVRLDRIEKTQDRIANSLDELAQRGHEHRILALEKHVDGMWAKVLGLVTAISATIATVLAWAKGWK